MPPEIMLHNLGAHGKEILLGLHVLVYRTVVCVWANVW